MQRGNVRPSAVSIEGGGRGERRVEGEEGVLCQLDGGRGCRTWSGAESEGEFSGEGRTGCLVSKMGGWCAGRQHQV